MEKISYDRESIPQNYRGYKTFGGRRSMPQDKKQGPTGHLGRVFTIGGEGGTLGRQHLEPDSGRPSICHRTETGDASWKWIFSSRSMSGRRLVALKMQATNAPGSYRWCEAWNYPRKAGKSVGCQPAYPSRNTLTGEIPNGLPNLIECTYRSRQLFEASGMGWALYSRKMGFRRATGFGMSHLTYLRSPRGSAQNRGLACWSEVRKYEPLVVYRDRKAQDPRVIRCGQSHVILRPGRRKMGRRQKEKGSIGRFMSLG